LEITILANSAMPSIANVAEVPNLMTSNLPGAVLHRGFDLMACQIAGATCKLHMSRTTASGLIGTTVSITMVM